MFRISSRFISLAVAFGLGATIATFSTAGPPTAPDLSELRDAVNKAHKRGENVTEVARALGALEKSVAKGWAVPAPGRTVPAPAELTAVREAVERAKRKGEDVDAIRKQLELVETAMTGRVQSDPPRLLVVSSNRDGNWEIYLVRPGTGEWSSPRKVDSV